MAAGFELVADSGNGVVRGDLTIRTAPGAVRRGAELLALGKGELVLDLGGLEHCDSAALAVLLEWRREAARAGRQLAWKNVPERLRQLARISELESVLQFT